MSAVLGGGPLPKSRVRARREAETRIADAVLSATPSNDYAANVGWESERLTALRTQARNATLVGAAGAAIAVLSLVAVVSIERSRQFIPVPIVVDRVTGETTTAAPLAAGSVPAIEAIDKASVAKFVQAREGYAWDFLQRDYNAVGRMASPEVFKTFNAQFDGPKALDKELGAGVVWRVRVLSVRLDLDSVKRKGDTRGGEAVVTYEKDVRDVARGITEPPTRHVATLRYEYQPKAMRTESDRLDNPLGFVVTAYRSDVEVRK